MKRWPLYLDLGLGVLCLCVGYACDAGYYATFFASMGLGMMLASAVQVVRMRYYEMPRNREKWEHLAKQRYIDSVDERKAFLRMKSGALVYQMMTFVFLLLAFVLALFRVQAWVVALVFGLFVLQSVLGMALYKHFERTL